MKLSRMWFPLRPVLRLLLLERSVLIDRFGLCCSGTWRCDRGSVGVLSVVVDDWVYTVYSVSGDVVSDENGAGGDAALSAPVERAGCAVWLGLGAMSPTPLSRLNASWA